MATLPQPAARARPPGLAPMSPNAANGNRDRQYEASAECPRAAAERKPHLFERRLDATLTGGGAAAAPQVVVLDDADNLPPRATAALGPRAPALALLSRAAATAAPSAPPLLRQQARAPPPPPPGQPPPPPCLRGPPSAPAIRPDLRALLGATNPSSAPAAVPYTRGASQPAKGTTAKQYGSQTLKGCSRGNGARSMALIFRAA